MFAFVRVFAFYVGSAALLTWGLFAMGWADALEMEGFSNTPVVEQVRERPQSVAVGPVTDPIPKSALPREVRAPGAESVAPAPLPTVEPKVAVVAAPVAQAPAPAAVTAAPVAPVPPVKVVAIAVPERAPSPEPVRQPEPVRPSPVSPSPPPATETRQAPSIVAAPRKNIPAVATQPVKQADIAPSAPPLPAAVPAHAAVRPAPAPPPDATRSPAPSRAAAWATVRRIAGFGHDALVDQLEDNRRSPGDVPCIVMRELSFKAGTQQFKPKVQQELATVAKVLMLFPERRLEIGSRLGPGRPMASDAKLRAERAGAVRNALISLGVAGDKLVVEPGDSYDRVGDDLTRAGASRVQSVGLCVRDI